MQFIDSEIELLEIRFSHPERFINSPEPSFKSDLYLMPNSRVLGIIGMAEIVEAIHLSGEVFSLDGKPAFKSQIANRFEQAFNFSFGDISDKKFAIYNRKPFNLTKHLDILRTLIEREHRKRMRK